jgi:hypothetical protein
LLAKSTEHVYALTGTGDWGPPYVTVYPTTIEEPFAQIGRIAGGENPLVADVGGDYLYVGEFGRAAGLAAYDVSRPDRPRSVGRITVGPASEGCLHCRGVVGVAANHDGTIVASHWNGGVDVVRMVPPDCQH